MSVFRGLSGAAVESSFAAHDAVSTDALQIAAASSGQTAFVFQVAS